MASAGKVMAARLLELLEPLTGGVPQDAGQIVGLGLVAVAVIMASWRVMWMVERELKVRRMNMPLVPGGTFILGQALNMIRGTPWDLMVRWMRQYGPVYRFQLFGENCVVVADPKALQEVFQSKMRSFKKDLDFTYKPFMVLLGTGLVTSEGSLWAKQRTHVSPVFRIEILEIIPDIAKRAVERLAAKLEPLRGTGEAVDIGEMFRHLTLQVIAEAILSLSPEESDSTFAHMYLPIVTEGNLRTWYPYRAYLPTPAFWRFQRHVKVLNDYITSIIVSRWALREQEARDGVRTRREDILDRILGQIDPKAWGAVAIRQLRDEVKTFILAGHETSASMLAWALYEVAQSGELRDRLVREANEVFGEDNGPSTPLPPADALGNLVLSQCCLKEALRKYSVVPVVTRESTKDVVLQDKYFVPAGTRMMLLIQGVHHRPDIWPEPSDFRPDRFLKAPEPFTFLPFIDGPRNCLGQHLALLEAKVVLSTLLQRFTFTLAPSADPCKRHPYMVPVIPDEPGLLVTVA